MLPHYSPYKVAENFSLLANLYPGRIDLGVGRAIAKEVNQRDALAATAPNLGVDVAAGKTRRCLRKGTKHCAWYIKGALRGKRLWAVAATIGLRVEEEAERHGLDISLHDESGYNL